MKRKYLFLLVISTVFAIMCICYFIGKYYYDNSKNDKREHCNSVYYWKTVFALCDEEKQWLKEHNIRRMYIRYFDVVMDYSNVVSFSEVTSEYIPVPNATIRFVDSVPDNLEVVPTVFIDNKVFKECKMMNTFAERLVTRILIMSETNNVRSIREVQLDCDWTATTEKEWFAFAALVKEELKKSGIILSATIRLHQLNQPVPPVDRGVLMCYNTGGVKNYNTTNSILNRNDVALYAKHLKSYKLPLDIAYPTFSWAAWFNCNRYFQALIRDLKPDNENIKIKNRNYYEVVKDFYKEEKYLREGDLLRFEFSHFTEIMSVKNMLEPNLKKHSIILFHLDNYNLSKYSTEHINQIFSHK